MLKYIYLLLGFILLCLHVDAQQLSIQTGHSSAILDLEFSPNGKILVSCGTDNKIILWDMISLKQMNILSGHTDVVNSITIHPTKNIIASASNDNTVKIWEYPSGRLLNTYSFFNNEVKSVVFKPDGTELACGSENIYLINLITDKHEKLNIKAKKYFNAIAYSSDNNHLAFGDKTKSRNYIYNLVSKKIEKTFKTKANDIVFSKDNSAIFIAGNKGVLKKIKAITKKTEKSKSKFTQTANYSWNAFYSLVYNSEYLIASNKNNIIYVYNIKNGKKVESLKAHKSEVRALAINNNGEIFASAGKDYQIILWNTKERRIIKRLIGGARSINNLSFSENGNQMFIAYSDGSFKIWDLKKKTKISVGNYNSSKHRSFRNEISTENTISEINTNKIPIKISDKKLDKYNNSVLSKKEKIIFWDLNNKKQISKIRNNKSTAYQTYSLVDTNIIISFKHKATHSQRISLLDHKKIKLREVVFSTKVTSYEIPKNNKKIKNINKYKQQSSFNIKGDVYYKTVSDNGKLLLVLKNTQEGAKCEIWGMKSGRLRSEKLINYTIAKANFSSNNQYVYITDINNIYLYCTKTLACIDTIIGNYPIAFSQNDKQIAYTNKTRNLILYNIESKKSIFNIPSQHLTNLSDIEFNKNHNYIATSGFDGLIKFWDINTGEQLLSLASFNDNDFIYVSKNNYYFSSKGAMNYIGFLVNEKLYSFEQFDLKYNRPDIVLANLDYSEKNEIFRLEKAYNKRIKKLGFSKDVFESDFNIPSVKIINGNNIPLQTENNMLKLTLNAKDKLYNINRLNVWINDVAIYGTNGIDLASQETKEINKTLDLELASGKNKIQISCLNEKGGESYKETFETTYKPNKKRTPDMYIVTIGTSEYSDKRFNLNFAAKDANDIATLYKKNKQYNNVFIKTLTDKEVTKDNIKNLRAFFEKAKIDDVVMLFIAGHGVLDSELDYYYGTYDIDFNNPSNKGIVYSDMEALLDGIKSLKKLLFMDTCHSGEVDKDEMELATIENTEKGEVTFRAAGAGVRTKEGVGVENTNQLMTELFSDLRRGTGATVISSAGGAEFAMESGEWKNGLFTYCLINGINNKDADINNDGKIMLSELQKYVQTQVLELSKGKQQPTSRIENISMDFQVW